LIGRQCFTKNYARLWFNFLLFALPVSKQARQKHLQHKNQNTQGENHHDHLDNLAEDTRASRR
jgi:hypothetical protein